MSTFGGRARNLGMVGGPGNQPLSYGSYLRTGELLALQLPASSPPHHDETLFIVIHQAYELWFKLILHELDQAMVCMDGGQVLEAQHVLSRVTEVLKLCVSQIHILETMRPIDFLKFREHLNPASGFQSGQFREIEFVCGLKEERFLRVFQNEPSVLKLLEKRLASPDLPASLWKLLEREGVFETHETQPEQRLAKLARIYQRPERHLPLYLLLETLVTLDEQLVLFRTHHVHVVERIIGTKQGTGGSPGVEYLRTTLAKRCFPLLWEVRGGLTQ